MTIVLAAAFLEELIRLPPIFGGLIILAAVILLIRRGVPKYIQTTDPL